MKKIFLLAISSLLLILLSPNTYAGDHPEAHFGVFGIQHLPTLAQYQNEYVGKVVMYLPASNGPTYNDNKFEGKHNTPYKVLKIKGNNQRMKFVLQSLTDKTKVNFVVNNQYEYYSYGKYTYCITDEYSVPLLNLTKFEEIKKSKVGTVINNNFEVTDMVMSADVDDNNKYPVPFIIIKNKKTDGEHRFPYDKADVYSKVLGTTFKSDKVITTYEVVDVVFEKSDYYPYKTEEKYVLKNSITGNTKKIEASKASTACFDEDLSGEYISILSTVERPTDSSKRYGKTTTIKDQGVTKFSYVDELIDILIVGTSRQFNFVLKNVSENSIKIIWNEAAFVDFSGSTSKIMHVGTKYSQKDGDQPATTIIKNAKIDDLAVPTVNVRYSGVLKDWVIDSMYPNKIISEPGQLRLMLPIQIKDVINEYTFVFDVKYIYKYPERLK